MAATGQLYPFFSLDVLVENIRSFLQNPVRYISLLGQVFRGNLYQWISYFKGIYLFPKAVYTAKRLKMGGIEHIHAHYATHPGLEAWLIHKLTGISYSITIHSHDIYDCQAMLETKFKGCRVYRPYFKI